MEGLFELKEGAVLTVPPMSVKQNSSSRRRHNCPGTPKVLRLGVVKRRGEKLFFVKTFDDDTRRTPEEYGGKVLFSPANVNPGDQLRIEWVDQGCACASWAN
jgi:hypothetical protein